MDYDHILIIGFGAPDQSKDVRQFLEVVTQGTRIPEQRLKEVEHHYEAIGGGSPYNKYTFQLVDKIKEKLTERSVSLPVFIGMRNWHPFMKDTVAEIAQKGLKKGVGVILAPHRSDASFEKYIRSVEDAKKQSQGKSLIYDYLDSWHEHPGFIQTQTEEVAKVMQGIPLELREQTQILFSAHSIPTDMAEKSSYAEEVQASSQRVAENLKHSRWKVVYQSRSGNPRQPWLEPDIVSVIEGMNAKENPYVIVVPIGFLCDNAEVLFDLDIEAKEAAEKKGIQYLRASTVMDHARFAEMFSDLIQDRFNVCQS